MLSLFPAELSSLTYGFRHIPILVLYSLFPPWQPNMEQITSKKKKNPVRGQTVYKIQSKCYSKHLDVCPGLHGCPFSLHIYEVQIKGDFFMSVQNQCVQHHLLKSVAFPRLVAFVKIGCLYMCGFIYIFSILFY